jgi:hypothetical protein
MQHSIPPLQAYFCRTMTHSRGSEAFRLCSLPRSSRYSMRLHLPSKWGYLATGAHPRSGHQNAASVGQTLKLWLKWWYIFDRH